MKSISFTLSGDGENLGAFTLDPYTELRLMADAKANEGLTLPEYVREALRNLTLRDDYNGNTCCADESDVLAVSDEIAAADQSYLPHKALGALRQLHARAE
jgi:hypothetical protein